MRVRQLLILGSIDRGCRQKSAHASRFRFARVYLPPPSTAGLPPRRAAPRPRSSARPCPAAAQVDRWFEETLYEAQRGDVKQQALLAQMFAQGYGTPRDAKAAAKWEERSRARGYKMKGVSAAGARLHGRGSAWEGVRMRSCMWTRLLC